MAGRISKETVSQIYNQTDIVALIGETTKLERRSGNDWWGCCPFHHEKTASFHVDGDKRMFYCFSCHKSGNAVGFAMETQSLNYLEALQYLAKRSGITIQYEEGYGNNNEKYEYDDTKDRLIELYERTANMFNYFLLETQEGKEALDYLTKRGLTRETIEKFRLGYAPKNYKWLKQFLKSKNFSDEFLAQSKLFSKNYPDIAFFSDRVMFPIFNRHGQTVAFSGRILHSKDPKTDRKYMNTPEMIQYKKRETLFAFNFARNAIRTSKTIIFCEGNMDVIAYHQAGVENAVATCGTALTEDHLKMIKGLAETIILAFDSDDAGQEANKKSIYMCRRQGFTVKVLQLKGGKDASEILQNFGKENLTNQVANSILDSDYLLNRLGELYLLDTPEGKSKAAFEFFDYVDSLQSYSHKESSLDQLCQTLNLSPEAVRKDFQNRKQTKPQNTIQPVRQTNIQKVQNPKIQMNAEMRGILAVVCNLEKFSELQGKVSESDFKNPAAIELYNILKECYEENLLSLPIILDRCKNEELVPIITQAVSSNAYAVEDSKFVADFVKFLNKNKLESRISELQVLIRNFTICSEEDKEVLNTLLKDKMQLEAEKLQLEKEMRNNI
ncbi:MAG: DNA primase [Treponema sp.]|nr:DNA primase [Treponema sp.]